MLGNCTVETASVYLGRLLMIFRKTFFVACAAFAVMLASPAFGQVWNEMGDAPDGVPARQDTAGIGPLLNINGATSSVDQDWVDTYSIVIIDPVDFYATTASSVGRNTGSATFDTRLWLWDEQGNVLLGNDDTASDGLQSTISDPSTFAGFTGGAVNADAQGIFLAPGKYLLSISGFDNDPFDAAGVDLVNLGSPFSDLRGPNQNAGAFSVWGQAGATGEYRIELGGATFCTIPEPASSTLLVLGSLAMCCVRRRK